MYSRNLGRSGSRPTLGGGNGGGWSDELPSVQRAEENRYGRKIPPGYDGNRFSRQRTGERSGGVPIAEPETKRHSAQRNAVQAEEEGQQYGESTSFDASFDESFDANNDDVDSSFDGRAFDGRTFDGRFDSFLPGEGVTEEEAPGKEEEEKDQQGTRESGALANPREPETGQESALASRGTPPAEKGKKEGAADALSGLVSLIRERVSGDDVLLLLLILLLAAEGEDAEVAILFLALLLLIK